jgi:superfamily I DNA/RNA helicase
MSHRLKIFGPPGTGKTETLLRTIEEARLPSHRVGFVTFTRTAREEALLRLGGTEAQWPLVRTLHSMCYRALQLSNGRMIGKADISRFAEIVGVEVSEAGENFDDDETSFQELPIGDQLLRLNHLGRHRCLRLREAIAELGIDVPEPLALHFTKTYREWKNAEGLMDYTDLLTLFLERDVHVAETDLFIVDEAQDLSPLQWAVAEKLAGRSPRFIVAGDDDQAIYSWAGATADLFLDWSCDEARVLEQSYRLPLKVHTLVNEISTRIEHRKEKVYHPRTETGHLEYTGVLPDVEDEEALVLYRYGFRGKQLAKELRNRGVAFGGRFSPLGYPDTVAALRALNGSVDKDHLAAARRLSSKSPNPTSITQLDRAYYHDYLMLVHERVGLQGMLQPRVTLSSIHQSKGRQARTVVLDTALSRSSYEHLQLHADDEHRVWYVGASRAKEMLVVYESGASKYTYDI